MILVVVAILLLLSFKPVSGGNPFWFQVGVFMQGQENVTGGSVRIRTHVPAPDSPQSQPRTGTAFWVGLDLPNDAFIQVGYYCPEAINYPLWFWEYFPPNTASNPGAGFALGSTSDQEEEVGPDGSWHTYSLQSSGNTWYAYVDGVQEGSHDLGVSNSGGNTPYAFAEVNGVVTTDIVLGPVEFANLSYRDMDNVWHLVPEAFAVMGYGAGSGTLPPGSHFPYGLQVLGVNDWMAGSGLPQTDNYTTIWNGSTVVPEFPVAQLPIMALCMALALIMIRKLTKTTNPKIHPGQ